MPFPALLRTALPLTQNELILYCGLAWAGAVAVMIALDYLGNNWPKRRFRPRGWLEPRQLTQRLGFRRKVRAVKDEQIRETLEQNLGTPTLAVSRKRRQAAIDRRPLLATPEVLDASSLESLHGSGFAEPAESNGVDPLLNASAEDAWRRLEAAGWNAANRDRIEAGQPPVRWNPITASEETAILSTVGDAIVLTWPNPPDDPFTNGDG